MITKIELATENDAMKRKLSVNQHDPNGDFVFLIECVTKTNPDGTFELEMMNCPLSKLQVKTLALVLAKLANK